MHAYCHIFIKEETFMVIFTYNTLCLYMFETQTEVKACHDTLSWVNTLKGLVLAIIFKLKLCAKPLGQVTSQKALKVFDINCV